MLRSTPAKIILIVLFALGLGYFDLPSKFQSIPKTPEAIKKSNVNLGLDLQGGSQLDYKIDLRKVPEKDQKAIVEGVREVINRRVNSLGVSEPNIYTSTVGNEQHLIVELAGVKDLNEAKKIVGKTIQLEFKEKREKEDPQQKAQARKLADSILQKALAGKDSFGLIGQEEMHGNPGKVLFREEHGWKFESEIPDSKIANTIVSGTPGAVTAKVLEGNDGYTYVDGQVAPMNGFFIVKLIEKRSTAELPEAEKALEASHILISYKDALNAKDSVARAQEEAKTFAQNLLNKLKAGANFEKLAKENSDDTATAEDGGRITTIMNLDASYDPVFVSIALNLKKPGELSDVLTLEDGFHIIRAENFTQVKYDQIFVSSAPDPWQDTGLTGEHFEYAEVQFDNFLRPTVSVQFDADGAKLFEQITERNVGKPLAIFVGGNIISSPNVNEKISGGTAVITGQFSVEEAQELARDLNTGAIPAPVVLSGQYTIGASLGEEALNKSLRAGLIGIILLIVFMILYYRLPGLIAVLALTFYTVILLFLIKSELPLAFALTAAILIFIGVISALLHSKDDGWEKFITFVLACFVLFFVTFLLKNAIVLTLAGVAGVILSIGMAVDANVLIFERMKEELRAGRPLSSAIDVGFDRAWSSIRDSNFSSLITCGILFFFGTSIIQGFAFNLAAGILISMFTAITVTRTLLRAVIHSRLAEKHFLWGRLSAGGEQKTYHIVGNSKIWFGASGAVLGVSLIAIIIFGLKLGLDFTGGTLMDIQFEKTVTVEQLKTELAKAGDSMADPASNKPKISKNTPALESGSEPLRLDAARIVPAGENHFLVTFQHISSETHDRLISVLQEKFGAVTENRFTTVGPVVGETLKKRAILAIAIAMFVIVLYIAFAFRKIPKRVSPWKFGFCAIAALFHDVLIPVGIFAIFQFEVDALFITALLTVLGFSVHDTIVVFDRIRENLKYQGRDESFAHVANKSMNQTIARSVNTSLTTLVTLASLLIFGSASIFHFILVLVIGILVGTYSSIFIASPLLVLWQKKEQQ